MAIFIYLSHNFSIFLFTIFKIFQISQCDPNYSCLSKQLPPCFEGEIRSIANLNKLTECQTEYEHCWDGQFHKQSCPFGEHFYLGKCQVCNIKIYNKNKNGGEEINTVIYEKCQASFYLF